MIKFHKREYYIIGSSLVLAGTALYLVITRRRQIQILKDIDYILDQNIMEYGTTEDLKSNIAFDPRYYLTVANKSGARLFTLPEVRAVNKDIYDRISAWDFNKDVNGIISVFKKFKSKAQVSMASDYFQKDYNRDLFQFLSKMDSTWNTVGESALNVISFGIYSAVRSKDNMDEIQRIVNSLPNY